MKNKYAVAFGPLVFLFMLAACINKGGPDPLTTDRVKRLLSLDSGKVWVRTALRIDGEDIEIPDCELQNRYSFSSLESDTLFYIGSPPGCTTLVSDTLGTWSWEVITNIRDEFKDSLKLVDSTGQVERRYVRELTSDNLSWEYLVDTERYRETFIWLQDPDN